MYPMYERNAGLKLNTCASCEDLLAVAWGEAAELDAVIVNKSLPFQSGEQNLNKSRIL